MLLFKKPFFAGLESGAITLTFRRWQKPHVRPGGRYRCHPIGVLEVDAIDKVTVATITQDDAARAGFPSREALVEYLAELGPLEAATELYRVVLHHGGDGDRVELALAAELTPEDVAGIAKKLAAMDRAEAWTRRTMAIIDKHPRVAASKLAAKLGRETQPFKIDVRKLKKLGLTQSFEVGYEISPRGRAYLAAGSRKPATTRKRKAAPKRTR
ncbi:MAG TPA: ASCH domain-containing protein [Kofleriaceae bacterium]|nr:ASCH domain-containing protein [Kofleriaceae bacterium]